MKYYKDNDMSLGRFISLILRHSPETIGIKLDKNGWANIDELIYGMNKARKKIDKNTLLRIVKENNKQRYSLNEDQTHIRANQGHSIDVDVELKTHVPPDVLYHGTASVFFESIKTKGIIKGKRKYVHLSKDIETAMNVGKRHGNPIVFKIDAKKMAEYGHVFYISENGVWLTDNVPCEYIEKI